MLSRRSHFDGTALLSGVSVNSCVKCRSSAEKLGKPLSEEEINGQKRRALFISILLVPVFSYIYNVGINA